MKLYILLEFNDHINSINFKKIYYKKPIYKEIKKEFYNTNVLDEEIKNFLKGETISVNIKYKYQLAVINLDDKKVLNNMDKELQLIVFVDREDLGASIDSVHLCNKDKNNINKKDLQPETIEFITESCEQDDDTLDYNNKDQLIDDFIKHGTVWGRNYESMLTTLYFYTKAIK